MPCLTLVQHAHSYRDSVNESIFNGILERYLAIISRIPKYSPPRNNMIKVLMSIVFYDFPLLLKFPGRKLLSTLSSTMPFPKML